METLRDAPPAPSDYEQAFSRLAGLRPAIDRFFDDVLVMDDDPELRRARLSLLARIDELARAVVDVSHLVVERAAES